MSSGSVFRIDVRSCEAPGNWFEIPASVAGEIGQGGFGRIYAKGVAGWLIKRGKEGRCSFAKLLLCLFDVLLGKFWDCHVVRIREARSSRYGGTDGIRKRGANGRED